MDDPGERYATDIVTQIETNLDDLSPEITGAILERLIEAGALDAFFLPAQMKKNRPGTLLTVLCKQESVGNLADIIFRETSSFGIRLSEKRRLKLDRRIDTVQTAYGEIEVKAGFDRAGRLLQAAPEFESCRAVAKASGQSLREVYLAAAQAYRERTV